ncbi:glycosyltransferase involved in cell wall biosynthesis [Serinibacter salmoneus]|uniref:D-inositol 3-phosphate glycosyltransferase n=1 Tax=Serinibacter salmoneus TaxID=556530 RepID=A0A2A9CWZ3_9MICO|nr:glycosyltransferase involved in cell wall biosynthesis [Serinibacter salmoneus]
MHIALLTHHYAPEVGAPQRRWRAFSRRFHAAGHRVSVLTPPPHYPRGLLDPDTAPAHLPGNSHDGEWGERVHRVRFRPHEAGLKSRSIDQAIASADSVATGIRVFGPRANRPDVIIGTAPGLPTIPAALTLGAALRRPVVVEMRDAWPDLIGPSGMLGPDDKRSPAFRRTVEFAHEAITRWQRNTAAVVTTTQGFAEVLRDRGVKRVHVVRNGSTLENLPVLPPPTPHPGLKVLYLGTMGRSQGLETTIRAAAMVKERGGDITLRVGGSGADEPALRVLARELHAPVEFLGRVPHEKVADQYAWCDTAVVSLRGWQPFEWTIPSKLYEIMGLRRHVSGSVAGEAAEIIKEAEAGFAVTPEAPELLAQGWFSLLADRSQLDVGDTGRRWVQDNAHHDRLASNYLGMLAEIVAR